MKKKKFIIGGIIIAIAIIIFIGYYPPFFPFIRYGFLSRPATKIVFNIENFSTSPDNFPVFLQEIENTVHHYWYNDVRLTLITAFFVPETDKEVVAYGFEFTSDSHKGASENLQSQLTVYYKANLIIKKWFIEKNGLINLQYHEGKIVNNQRLVATECIDLFPCQFIGVITGEGIEPSEIKISGKQAFEIALSKKPELAEEEYTYNGEPSWFGILRMIEGIPVWILSPVIKIDARNGELIE